MTLGFRLFAAARAPVVRVCGRARRRHWQRCRAPSSARPATRIADAAVRISGVGAARSGATRRPTPTASTASSTSCRANTPSRSTAPGNAAGAARGRRRRRQGHAGRRAASAWRVSESVTVCAVTPVVDVRSSDASLTVTDAAFNALPLEHSYRGLFQLSPGVARQPQPGGAVGRRQPPGQHLSARRRQHHQPGLRHAGDSGQSARHRRSEPDARRRHRRVRAHGRHRGQRREPQRLEPLLGAGPPRLAARGARERLHAARRPRGGRAPARAPSAIRC